jgi:hypothetical protein
MAEIQEKIALKGQAEEDIYFAQRDRELIEALRRKDLAEQLECPNTPAKKLAKEYQKRFEKVTRKHEKKPKKRARAYRKLLDEILHLCTPKTHERHEDQP